MRILLVNDYASATAGAERITLDLRDGLRARDHEVRVFASRAQLIPGESFADASCYGTNSRLQTLSSTFNPSAAHALRRELRDFAPDVVQVQMFLWQLSPAILPLLRRVPSVYYAMTFKSVCPTGLKWLPAGAKCEVRAGMACLTNGCLTLPGVGPLLLQRQLWRRARGAFSAIVCCSAAVQRELEADGISTHDVIWPGTPPARVVHAPRQLAGPPMVTFAGRLSREKGLDVLVRAFRIVRDRCATVRLRIAGTGPGRDELIALVRQLELTDAVDILGQLGPEALDAELDRSWVHAVPSCWPEPFGLTATEAMMRGTAVVASDIGGLADSVQHEVTGLLAPPGNKHALADALTRIVSNRALAERMGAAGLARARAVFSLDACLSRFERLYATLVRPAPVARSADAG